MKTILVIGGTGAQGIPVVKALATNPEYTIKIITRDTTSPSAQYLTTLPSVTLIPGTPYSEPTLHSALSNTDIVFANTNGFALGEKAEIYWGIRLYELCRQHAISHFIYAGLEYGSKLGNFLPKYRCGHLDGKGKVVQFLSAQPTEPMKWSVITSCMYMEALWEFLRPYPDPDADEPGRLVFAAPLGEARCPLICLEDYGRYVRWMVENAEQSNGLELHVATEDVSWEELAATFSEVTGKRAVYKDVTLDEYFSSGIFPDPEAKIGGKEAGRDDATLMSYRDNFSGFWNTWKDQLTQRDYLIMDRVLPDRVRSVREWMGLVGYDGGIGGC
ncbi:NmrA family protein [Aspergillus heteromorphus CBS 117.55]|uniref:NmrA family protein n=1 Tax=Aspergillus heteromorphus CBS 117.55 TaxID=1448321 RepID=A0A317V1C5_9EURO|nr:NmrA family protein [Aspergillus heteromorphus CBS 117.55]PWY65990.1 NmrA family protein [Aspergillus heteromorphus CBS 117.55]